MTAPDPGDTESSSARTDAREAEMLWPEAAAAAFEKFTEELEHRAKQIEDTDDADPVHDMRTGTRRLRTAARIYRSAFPNRELDRLERELRRVAHRLGEARDLDVMLEMLDDSEHDADGSHDATEPLRRAWKKQRRRAARRLGAELARPRFRRAIERATRLADGARSSADEAAPHDSRPIPRVAHRAPATIWKSFGSVLAYDLDPRTAHPDDIHQMRIAAKGFRYTLEAFEDAAGDDLTALIKEVTDLQDAAGKMHDAIVAAEMARNVMADDGLDPSGRDAIERFAAEQDGRAAALRPVIHDSLETVRSMAFRRALAEALVELTGGTPRGPVL
jgi:CHAD domain-containing protein